MSFNSRRLLHTFAAAKLISFFPFQPVERIGKVRFAFPTTSIFMIRNINILDSVDIKIDSRNRK